MALLMTVIPVTATLTALPWKLLSLGGLLFLSLPIMLLAWSGLRKSTLIGPSWWSVAALLAWTGVELQSALLPQPDSNLEPLRLAAIALSFCPVVAVLGAKRPQNLAWSFVVLALWGIVALPAAENLVLHPGQRLTLGAARSWFLWLLILLGPINYFPTRFALGAGLVATGQLIALSPYLALLKRPLVGESSFCGLACCALAILVTWLISRRPRATREPSNYLWLEFRDSFGLLWALRVQERVNELAREHREDCELQWSGFHSASGVRAEPPTALGLSLKSLVRRFLSPDRIDEILAGTQVPLAPNDA